MIPCDPAIQVPFPDGHVVPWWVDRERAQKEFSKISAKDAVRFVQVDDQLKKLARYLQPFFMEPPPEVDTSTMKGWADLFRVGRRFRGISNAEISQLVSFLTGSLGEFLDNNYESEKMKTMFLANNVYGKHGGPYQPGTAIGLLFHLLSGGEHELQGFYGHVMGGMGSITQALAAAGKKLGVEICTSASVARVEVRNGRARSVVLEDGTEIRGRMILSNADPKRTFLGLVEAKELPEDFLFAVRGIKMQGPCAKVNMVLSEEPRFTGTSPQATELERTFYTLVPSLAFAERCYDIAKFGEIPGEWWVTASSLRMPTLPWHLRASTFSPASCNMFPTTFAKATGTRNANCWAIASLKIAEYAAQCSGIDRGTAGIDSARSGTHVRSDRGQHFSRRLATGAALLYASGAGLVAIPHSHGRTLFVRSRCASRRGRDWRARTQRRPSSAARLEEGTIAGGGRVTGGNERAEFAAQDRRHRDSRRGRHGSVDRFPPREAEGGKHRRPRQGSCGTGAQRTLVRAGSHALQLSC